MGISDRIKRLNTYIKEEAESRYIRSYINIFICRLLYGATAKDYFEFEFYLKSFSERSKCLTTYRAKKLEEKYNDIVKRDILTNKKEFNSVFEKFIKREWIDFENISFEEFDAFFKKHKKIIIKPNWLCEGMGIFICEYQSTEQAKKLYDEYYGKDALAEEVLVQHHELAEFNSASVNCVRVVTLYCNGKPHIITCALRLGSGKTCTDNYHSGGLCVPLDLKTGVNFAASATIKRERVYVHPATNKQIIGFKAPNWELLRKTVLEAASMIPEVGWVGWDVAILENDIAIVEGNVEQGTDVIQIRQDGKWKYIKDIIAGKAD